MDREQAKFDELYSFHDRLSFLIELYILQYPGQPMPYHRGRQRLAQRFLSKLKFLSHKMRHMVLVM